MTQETRYVQAFVDQLNGLSDLDLATYAESIDDVRWIWDLFESALNAADTSDHSDMDALLIRTAKQNMSSKFRRFLYTVKRENIKREKGEGL
ncbi:MAG: hypothetical protein ACO24D_14795 [bacterium]